VVVIQFLGLGLITWKIFGRSDVGLNCSSSSSTAKAGAKYVKGGGEC